MHTDFALLCFIMVSTNRIDMEYGSTQLVTLYKKARLTPLVLKPEHSGNNQVNIMVAVDALTLYNQDIDFYD